MYRDVSLKKYLDDLAAKIKCMAVFTPANKITEIKERMKNRDNTICVFFIKLLSSNSFFNK